jgi:hypothetical protein
VPGKKTEGDGVIVIIYYVLRYTSLGGTFAVIRVERTSDFGTVVLTGSREAQRATTETYDASYYCLVYC